MYRLEAAKRHSRGIPYSPLGLPRQHKTQVRDDSTNLLISPNYFTKQTPIFQDRYYTINYKYNNSCIEEVVHACRPS